MVTQYQYIDHPNDLDVLATTEDQIERPDYRLSAVAALWSPVDGKKGRKI